MKRTVVTALSLLLLTCGHKKSHSLTNDERLAPVHARLDAVRPLAPICEGFVSKGNCDQGDIMLFAGLLCLSGENIGCDTAGASIDAEGKVWRSPKGLGRDTPNSSSRDMFLGALAYIVGTKDVAKLELMTSYIQKNGNLCEDATDNRCDMNFDMRDLLDHVRVHFNLPALQPSRAGYSARLAASVNLDFEGFSLHLLATQLLILKKTGTWNSTLQYTANRLVTRQPQNPLFELIAHGVTDKFVTLMEQQVPSQTPKSLSQWSLERADSEKAWYTDSMIWEFVFVNNLAISW